MKVYEVLYEAAKDRQLVKLVIAQLNKNNSDCKATMSVSSGETKLAVISDSKQIPSCVRTVLKQMQVGMGAKTVKENKDGSFTLEFYITRF